MSEVLRRNESVGRVAIYLFEDAAGATAYLEEVAAFLEYEEDLSSGVVVADHYKSPIRTPGGMVTEPDYVCAARLLDEVVIEMCMGRGIEFYEQYSGEYAEVSEEFVNSAIEWVHGAVHE
jgi:hypothetical protein